SETTKRQLPQQPLLGYGRKQHPGNNEPFVACPSTHPGFGFKEGTKELRQKPRPALAAVWLHEQHVNLELPARDRKIRVFTPDLDPHVVVLDDMLDRNRSAFLVIFTFLIVHTFHCWGSCLPTAPHSRAPFHGHGSTAQRGKRRRRDERRSHLHAQENQGCP